MVEDSDQDARNDQDAGREFDASPGLLRCDLADRDEADSTGHIPAPKAG
jgi:hypothetical protein